jgi:hypothetical protein
LERDDIVATFIVNQADIMTQTKLILAADYETLQRLTQTEKEILINNLYKKYQTSHHLPYLLAVNILQFNLPRIL